MVVVFVTTIFKISIVGSCALNALFTEKITHEPIPVTWAGNVPSVFSKLLPNSNKYSERHLLNILQLVLLICVNNLLSIECNSII